MTDAEELDGYACEGNVLRLSLLRSSTVPDPNQDQGFHQFSFAVAPHRGSFAESRIPVAGRLFNSAPHVRRIEPRAGEKMARPTFEMRGDRNIVLDTVKRGEDDHFTSTNSSQTVVLRIYEAYGGHGTMVLRIRTSREVKTVSICDVSCCLSIDVAILTDGSADTRARLGRVECRGCGRWCEAGRRQDARVPGPVFEGHVRALA